MIEARQFGTSRKSPGLFRVPPHMIGDLQGTVTHASIEQQSIEFRDLHGCARGSSGPSRRYVTAWFLGKPKDLQAGTYSEFLAEGLMRGDIASRYAAYAVGVQWGWLSREDVREMEQLPMVEGKPSMSSWCR